VIKREQIDSHIYTFIYDDLYNQLYGQISVTCGKWTFDYVYSSLTLQYYNLSSDGQYSSLVNIVLTDLEKKVLK
jgi:hypothetical protein